ncbi:fimbrial protein [Rhodanobacter sp. Soil772]|uniref:fimbrial protein n=1 Tax=Rhodanobacter sp. Soil772 TaxID=1736406 RepID=UPI000ABAFF1C|nr:fimbrial protein [Rhodanobacter sp. Soil772]
MKHQPFIHFPRALAGLLLLAGLLGWAPNAAADGNGNGTTQPCTPTPTAAFLPAISNFAVSSTAYGPIGSPVRVSITFNCGNNVFAGQVQQISIFAQPAAGGIVDPTYGLLFPTSVSNIYLQLTALAPAHPLTNQKSALIDVVKSSPSATVRFQAQYIKLGIGAVNSGTLSTINPVITSFNNADTVSPGGSSTYGSLNVAGSTTVTSVSCTATSPTVVLPTVLKNALASAGATSGRTPFAINISGCPTGVQVAISLSGTPASSSGTPLPAASGIAQSSGSDPNVAVQILDGDTLAPVDISGTQTKSLGTTQSGVTLVSRYYAQYYAVQPAAGGTVASHLTYTLSYP